MGAFDRAWKILKEDPNMGQEYTAFLMSKLLERYRILSAQKEQSYYPSPELYLEMRQIESEIADLRQQIPPSPQTQVQPTSGDYYQTQSLQE
tara:strand:+ start:547 stop:822 length:276 start_codon:yes stop_codon:yes gene_type:complete